MQQYGSKYFACRPPSLNPHTCRKMVANILPSDPLPTPLPWWVEGGVKVQLFQNMVMWQIKLKRMEHKAPCKHIFSPYTHPQPVG